ncbi:MAG: FAD-dependent oxidoreductase, partial [Rhizomicrobium sp.]
PDVEVTDCISYGWNEDPYSQGTYSGFAPGQFSNGYESLAQHEGRVLMAGGDVGNAAWRNFIDGAIGRGLRAAQDAVELLRG